MVDFAGWEMPQQYTSVKREQEAVRTGAGLFDVSHMGRFEIRGDEAGKFLQRVVTNDVGGLAVNRAQYNLICKEDGGILDDLVVYRGENAWTVVVNASNREKDLAWLRQYLPDGIEIEDVSEQVSLLALQGPGAQSILPAEGVDLDAIPYFGLAPGGVAGTEATISRTGYTGEDGFELFVPSAGVGAVWDALLAAGAVPCGLAARDVCRLEAGLRLYGNDMDESVNPYEAGLGWTVRLKKGDFVGRAALEQIKAEGPQRLIIGLGGAERTIPRHGLEVRQEGRTIGTVTSGTYSFWLQKGIGMALVEAGATQSGGAVEISGRGAGGRADVVALPFYRGSVRQVSRA